MTAPATTLTESGQRLPLLGHKRPRSESGPRSSQTRWLHAQFGAFLHAVLTLLTHKAGKGKKASSRATSGPDAEAMLQLHVLALATVMHFAAHACSLSQHVSQGGVAVRYEVVALLLRRILTAGGRAATGAYSDSAVLQSSGSHAEAGGAPGAADAEVVWLLGSDMSTAAAGFRVEFVDEYSDIRYATLKIIRDIAREVEQVGAAGGRQGGKKAKRAKGGAGGSGAAAADGAAASTDADDARTDSGFDSIGKQLLASVKPSLLASAAVDLLLGVSLPLTAEEWDAAAHVSWAQEQAGDDVEKWKQQHPVEAAALMLQTGKASQESQDAGSGAATTAAAAAAAAATASKAKFLSADSDSEDAADMDADETAAVDASGSSKKRSGGASVTGPKWADYTTVKRAYAEAWIAVLRLPLPPDAMRRVLLVLSTRIIPLMPGRLPLLLADFLTAATDAGGAVALMALEALFQLMQQHGLEYPRFYARLYALLTPDTLHAKYRGRCFTLLDLFMSSSALPAYLVAAFAKRMARLTLTAPTPTLPFALVFIYNCLKRHPPILPLLHRVPAAAPAPGGSGAGAGGKTSWPVPADPFDATTDDPAACKALESSLWELAVLQHYAHATVSNVARVFTSALTAGSGTVLVGGAVAAPVGLGQGPGGLMLNKPEYEVSTYASSTYQSLIAAEKERGSEKKGKAAEDGKPVKAAPVPFEFRAPSSFFVTGSTVSTEGEADRAQAGSSSVLDSILSW